MTVAPAKRIPVSGEKLAALRRAIAARGVNPDDHLDPATGLPIGTSTELWANDVYVVSVERRDGGTVSVLSIHRRDRKPIRDWRHMQRIKNDVAGPEVEAVELYPAESRLMDTANEYWLWCLPPGERWGFGFANREVTGAAEAAAVGARQRPLDDVDSSIPNQAQGAST